MNWALLQNSLLVAGLSTITAVVLGLFAATWAVGLAKCWRRALLVLGATALVLPPFLVTSCWIYFAGETGVWRDWFPIRLYSIWGTVWVLSLLHWPITMFLVSGSWTRLDQSHLESDLAVRGWRLFGWILLPRARGALVSSALVTFVLALNNFAVPAILQTRVFPAEVWVSYSTSLDVWGALKLSAPLTLAPVVLLLIMYGRGVEWPTFHRGVEAKRFRSQLGSSWVMGSGLMTSGLLILSVGMPLFQLLGNPTTWSGFWGAFAASWQATSNSFLISAGVATLCVLAGLFLWQWRMMSVFWTCFLLPGVFLGIGLIYLFNRPGFMLFYQSVGIVLFGMALRYVAVSWYGARRAMQSTDPGITSLALLDGASGLQRFRHVYWPQIGPSMAATWYVIYLLCLWDAETLLLIVPPGGETLALRIFNLLHYGYTGQVNALCIILLALALGPGLLWLMGSGSRRFGLGTRVWGIFGTVNHAYTGGRGVTQRSLLTGCARNVWVNRAAVACACGAALLWSGCDRMEQNESSVESRFFSKVQVIGNRGTAPGQFNKPRSLAVDALDNLYVVDMTGRVQKFTSNGVFVLSWQMPQTDKGKPKGMGCDNAGNIIVIEPHYSRVNHYSPEGKLVEQWGEHGTTVGKLTLPRSVAVNSRGEIIVSEYTAVDRVQMFTATNKQFVRAFGKMGTGAGEFNRAEGLAVDSEDRIYVADSCNHRVQVFSADGKFIRLFGRAGADEGELSYPYDIKVDAFGFEFVCEFGNSRVQVFNDQGQSVEVLGGAGSAPGQFNNPWGLAFDSKGNLYVADALNHRVQKFIRHKS